MPSGESTNPTVGKSGKVGGGVGGLFSFTCGCKGSKSVSVVALTPHHLSNNSSTFTGATTSCDTHLKSRTSTSNSGTGSLVNTSNHHEQRLSIDSMGSSICSFSTLLRDLGELERSVVGLHTNTVESAVDKRSSRSSTILKTVAVVAETKDPVGDFRKSMLSMIFAHDIDTEDELWDLAIQFLNLNSPQNHPFILRAFADVCSDIFRTPAAHSPASGN
ncbi:hypothetical protein ZOSMA_1G01080 [Zostera marina]|uniref:Transcription repressor n=1 Tax=Zostera marina TaxID=29655 RepID=A0A0K9PPI9_ZOSMR|nr:hypothetical protein ZOSMA_1G01080 [Zostera marina]